MSDVRILRRQLQKGILDLFIGLISVVIAGRVHGLATADIIRIAVPAASLLALPVIRVIVLAASGTYGQIWHHTSLQQIARLWVANLVVPLLFILPFLLSGTRLPLGLLVTDWALSTIGLCALRTTRVFTKLERVRRKTASWGAQFSPNGPHRVLIAGAGTSGVMLLRELLASQPARVEVVGFLDDNWTVQGLKVDRVPVLGTLKDLERILEEYRVTELIVAMPSADPELQQQLIRTGESAGINVRTVQGVERLIAGNYIYRPGEITLKDLEQSEELETIGLATVPADERRRRVLITGGAGYVGSHLTRKLLEKGYSVRVLDNFTYGEDGLEQYFAHPRLEIQRGDICNVRDISQAVQDVSTVIALAAIVGDPACRLSPEDTFNLNYESTKILIETCNFYGVERVLFASSCSVYGASNRRLLTERSPINPVSLYARTRILSENVLFDRAGNVEPVVFRLATVFGLSPRMRYDLVVNTLTVRAVVDHKITIMGGNQWRPNVHCQDVADAFVLAMEAPSHKVTGEIFNLGANRLNSTILELGELVAARVPEAEFIIEDDAVDPRDYRVDFSKLKRTLGFRPRFSIEEGISELIEALEHQSHLCEYQNPIYHNVKVLEEWMPRPVIGNR